MSDGAANGKATPGAGHFDSQLGMLAVANALLAGVAVRLRRGAPPAA
jgi:hypothetical protein